MFIEVLTEKQLKGIDMKLKNFMIFLKKYLNFI